MTKAPSSGATLHVDPIACVAHGLCGELLPEWIAIDEWGYPIVDDGRIPEALIEHAKRAAAACPTLALRLEHHPQAATAERSNRRRKT